MIDQRRLPVLMDSPAKTLELLEPKHTTTNNERTKNHHLYESWRIAGEITGKSGCFPWVAV